MPHYTPTIPVSIAAEHLEGLNPRELQDIRQAAQPVASLDAAGEALDQIDAQLASMRRDVNGARVTFADDSDAPSRYSDADREQVRSRADAQLREKEADIRKTLHVATTKARQIGSQTGAAANEPSFAGMADSILDGANRLSPLLASQLAGADLPTIERRLEAIRLRGDDGEMIAALAVVAPLIAQRGEPADDAGRESFYRSDRILIELRSRYRDPRMTSAAARAARIVADLDEIERDIIQHREERIGDTDRANTVITWGVGR